MTKGVLLGLDVGEKRIGVALADGVVSIASPLTTVAGGEGEIKAIMALIAEYHPVSLIVGYPRNLQGEATAQTRYIEQFVARLKENISITVEFQDESLTSIMAEQRLQMTKKPFNKGDIDALAASYILQDYLETHGN